MVGYDPGLKVCWVIMQNGMAACAEVCQFYCGKVFKGRTVTRVTQGEDYRPRFHLSAADDTNGDSPLQGAPLVLTKSQFAELMRPSP